MPRSTREYLLRYAEQIEGDCDRIVQKAHKIIDTYTDNNPNHQQFFVQVGEVALQLKEMVDGFRREFM